MSVATEIENGFKFFGKLIWIRNLTESNRNKYRQSQVGLLVETGSDYDIMSEFTTGAMSSLRGIGEVDAETVAKVNISKYLTQHLYVFVTDPADNSSAESVIDGLITAMGNESKTVKEGGHFDTYFQDVFGKTLPSVSDGSETIDDDWADDPSVVAPVLVSGQWLYWIDSDTGSLMRVDFANNGSEEVFESSVESFDVDHSREVVYWSNATGLYATPMSGGSAIQLADLTNVPSPHLNTLYFDYGVGNRIVLFSGDPVTNIYVYDAADISGTTLYPDTSSVLMCEELLKFCYDPSSFVTYAIHRSSGTVTNVSMVDVDASFVSDHFDVIPDTPTIFAVDTNTGTVYWADPFQSKLIYYDGNGGSWGAGSALSHSQSFLTSEQVHSLDVVDGRLLVQTIDDVTSDYKLRSESLSGNDTRLVADLSGDVAYRYLSSGTYVVDTDGMTTSLMVLRHDLTNGVVVSEFTDDTSSAVSDVYDILSLNVNNHSGIALVKD